MAAPTVGAVMADLLPYLEVPRAQAPVIVTVPDLSGMEAKEAEDALAELGLSPVAKGIGERVTDQLPGADTALEAGSQVLLYLGGAAPETATVPDFTEMTPAQAAQTALDAGLTLRFSGNPDLDRPIRVQLQDLPPGVEVESGRTVTITFTDPEARD
jgi:stage V sporulation protein D (sporulation-specific penicillin-binding protein)